MKSKKKSRRQRKLAKQKQTGGRSRKPMATPAQTSKSTSSTPTSPSTHPLKQPVSGKSQLADQDLYLLPLSQVKRELIKSLIVSLVLLGTIVAISVLN